MSHEKDEIKIVDAGYINFVKDDDGRTHTVLTDKPTDVTPRVEPCVITSVTWSPGQPTVVLGSAPVEAKEGARRLELDRCTFKGLNLDGVDLSEDVVFHDSLEDEEK